MRRICNILVYILLSFGISWSSYFILKDSDKIMAVLITVCWYMMGPALAVIIIHKANKKKLLSYFKFNDLNIKALLLAPLTAFVLGTLVVLLIYYFGNVLDIELFGDIVIDKESIITNIQNISPEIKLNQIKLPEKPLLLLLCIILTFGSLIGGLINLFFTLGEELGWRGYLKGQLKYGFFSNNLITGILWGIWHFPIIYLGHNFGEDYQFGFILMILFCIAGSFLFDILTTISNSILIPSYFHGSINAIIPGIALFISNGTETQNGSFIIVITIAMLILSVITFFMREKIELWIFKKSIKIAKPLSDHS